MNFKVLAYSVALVFLAGCMKEDPVQTEDKSYYFPPVGKPDWDTLSFESQGWNKVAFDELKKYLGEKRTKSFMILVNGRIVVEEYFDGHTPTSTWQWNSAGKTLVSSLTGIAQEEGLININNSVSDYIGKKWTSAPEAKENLIKVKHLLTMTSGIDDEESQLTLPSKLVYKADAGSRWAYHNIFQKLMDVVAETSNKSYDDYFNQKIKDKIGMDGFWKHGVIFRLYHSSARSMARFGILAQNKGKWEETQIIPEAFLFDATKTSQDINPSYGYLWWLNGKSNFMLPGGQEVYNSTLIPAAPSDLYAAMGAEDQRLYLIPSKNMIIVRMGEAAFPLKPNFAASDFDNELWVKINKVIK